MATPTIGLKVPKTDGRPDRPASMSVGEWGLRAEALGYDSIWLSEAWGSDALVELAEAAVRTDDVRLCTAIVNVYSRTPAVLAMAGASLQRLSGGRAVIGVGASHRGVVEGLHGLAYERPVRRSHEAIEAINALTAGNPDDGVVRYRGEVIEAGGFPGFGTSVPVYNAALGEANRRATGRVADGWLPYLFPRSALADAFETIADAAEEAGRDADTIEVTPQILAAVSDDADAARDEIRRYVASYVGRLENYRNALAAWFPDEAAGIGEAWGAGDEEEARRRVSDELVDELGIAGTPIEAREQLDAVLEDPVVDCPIVYVPNSTPAPVRNRTIEALAPGRA